jgi:hypothetical protein
MKAGGFKQTHITCHNDTNKPLTPCGPAPPCLAARALKPAWCTAAQRSDISLRQGGHSDLALRNSARSLMPLRNRNP